jgi:hypothetical protein
MAPQLQLNYLRPALYTRCESGVWHTFGPMPFYEAVLLAVRKYRPIHESCVLADEISLIGMDAILAVRQRSDFPISMAIESPVQTRGSVGDRGKPSR